MKSNTSTFSFTVAGTEHAYHAIHIGSGIYEVTWREPEKTEDCHMLYAGLKIAEYVASGEWTIIINNEIKE